MCVPHLDRTIMPSRSSIPIPIDGLLNSNTRVDIRKPIRLGAAASCICHNSVLCQLPIAALPDPRGNVTSPGGPCQHPTVVFGVTNARDCSEGPQGYRCFGSQPRRPGSAVLYQKAGAAYYSSCSLEPAMNLGECSVGAEKAVPCCARASVAAGALCCRRI